jgi:hypothetical protein
MKSEMPVKIFIDACGKAQRSPKRYRCPLHKPFMYCVPCPVPKFIAWLMSDELYAEDANPLQLFSKHKTIPRGKRKGSGK